MKKNSKKILSILLCAILCLAMACPLFAATSGKKVTLIYNSTGNITTVNVSKSGSSKNYLVKDLTAVHQGIVTDQITVTAKTNVKFGAKGNTVYFIQGLLYVKGYLPKKPITNYVDGSFRTITERAVIAFQDDHGLKDDGIVGTATFAKLTGN